MGRYEPEHLKEAAELLRGCVWPVDGPNPCWKVAERLSELCERIDELESNCKRTLKMLHDTAKANAKHKMWSYEHGRWSGAVLAAACLEGQRKDQDERDK